jgi:hypothetical protein
VAGRFFRGPNEPDDSDDDLASLFGSVDDDDQGEAADERPAENDQRPAAHGERPAANDRLPAPNDEAPTRSFRRDGAARGDIDGPDVDVDDDPDAFEPAFPPAPSAATPPTSVLPDPREAPPSYEIPELSIPIPPRPDAAPRGPSTRLPGEGESTFFWGLTPNDAPDPLVHKAEDAAGAAGEASGASRTADEASEANTPDGIPAADATGRRPRGLVPPTVPLAPYVPPVYEEPPVDEEPPVHDEPGPDMGPEQAPTERPQPPLPSGSSPTQPTTPPAPSTPESSLAATLFGSPAPSPAEPTDTPTIAVPAWTPVAEPPGPPTADESEPEPEPEVSSAPGTVTLPWLTRSRSDRARNEAADGAEVSDSPEPIVPVPEPAPADQPPTENSSWSLFGDLFHEPHEGGDDTDDDAVSDPAPGGDETTAVPPADSVKASWPWGDSAAAPLGASGVAAFGATTAGGPEPGPAAANAADAAGDVGGAAAPAHAGGHGAAPGAAASGGANASDATGVSRRAHASRRAAASGGGRSGGSRSASDHEDDAGGPSPRAQRIMLIVAGALLLLLLLIALFIVGRTVMHPVAMTSPSPTATKTATPTPTPTATAAATGPVAPGKHPWDALRGGECLQPFTTAWANTFTVVDCASPHAAQMVYTSVFSADPKAAFPGADALASQINALCSRPGVLNLDAAGQLDDAQLQGSYPVTEKQWKSGQRSYYCFVSRSSGQPITGSLAGPGPQ